VSWTDPAEIDLPQIVRFSPPPMDANGCGGMNDASMKTERRQQPIGLWLTRDCKIA
jgi:hypothetical protein